MWIKVYDGITLNKPYLVYSPHFGQVVASLRRVYKRKENYWELKGDNCDIPMAIWGVTHYMELPEDPVEIGQYGKYRYNK